MDEDDLIHELTELLGAMRAGEQVAAMTGREMDDGAARDHMRVVEDEEARWVKVLAKTLRGLGAEAPDTVGAFYDKAMDIENFDFRLRFLSKGLDWVVRRIDQMIDEVEDLNLVGDLDDMRAAHKKLIEETDALVG
jgi:nitronate monooxygenase